jgi:hypothetical protein
MPKVITVKSPADGIVVHAGRGGSWSERKPGENFCKQGRSEAGLIAQNDGSEILSSNLSWSRSPRMVGTARALYGNYSRAGPDDRSFAATHACARADPPPAPGQASHSGLRIPRLAATREHDPRGNELVVAAVSRCSRAMKQHKRFDLKCSQGIGAVRLRSTADMYRYDESDKNFVAARVATRSRAALRRIDEEQFRAASPNEWRLSAMLLYAARHPA